MRVSVRVSIGFITKTHELLHLLFGTREAVNHTSSSTILPSSVLAEPFVLEDLHKVCMCGSRVEEQREAVFLSKSELRAEMLALRLLIRKMQTIVI